MKEEKSDTRSRILNSTWKLLEKHQGKGVRISDIAGDAGVSRQAVYLHFATRTELLAATVSYVDEIKGLNQRLEPLQAIESGKELIEATVEIWANYIPEIYGLAKALIVAKETDEAAANAWNSAISCIREVCNNIVVFLQKEGTLRNELCAIEAVDMYYTLLSIQNWEQLTIELGWSKEQYVAGISGLICHLLLK